MLLLERKGEFFQCQKAFMTTLENQHICDLGSRAEVIDFLLRHPDQKFFLNCDMEHAVKITEVNEDEAVFCGIVRWSSKRQALDNHRFRFTDDPA